MKKPIAKPSVIAGASLVAALVVNHFYRIPVMPEQFTIIGLPIFLAGMFLDAVAIMAFNRTKTPYKVDRMPVNLVTTGPMKYTRNPIYLGITMMLLGIAIALGTLPIFGAPLAFWLAMNFMQVPYEERLLKKIFRGKYSSFTKKTRRWI